jgi:uncharacterized membrane protein
MPRAVLGAAFIAAGALRFLKPHVYASIKPRHLPARREVVDASGVAKMLAGAGVPSPRTARPAGRLLIGRVRRAGVRR